MRAHTFLMARVWVQTAHGMGIRAPLLYTCIMCIWVGSIHTARHVTSKTAAAAAFVIVAGAKDKNVDSINQPPLPRRRSHGAYDENVGGGIVHGGPSAGAVQHPFADAQNRRRTMRTLLGPGARETV